MHWFENSSFQIHPYSSGQLTAAHEDLFIKNFSFHINECVFLKSCSIWLYMSVPILVIFCNTLCASIRFYSCNSFGLQFGVGFLYVCCDIFPFKLLFDCCWVFYVFFLSVWLFHFILLWNNLNVNINFWPYFIILALVP